MADDKSRSFFILIRLKVRSLYWRSIVWDKWL